VIGFVLAAAWLGALATLMLVPTVRRAWWQMIALWILRWLPVEERARGLLRETKAQDEVEFLREIDDWATDTCVDGHRSLDCCDWQRLHQLVWPQSRWSRTSA
jgi:hypothetical protein